MRHEPKPFRLRGWFLFLSPGHNLRCFGVRAVSAQQSRLQVSASRRKSLGARGYFKPNRDKDMPKANNEPKPFRLRGWFVCVFVLPGRMLRCFGVVAVSAQARLQVSASAAWFGIVDTALDSAGASRKKQQNIKQRPGHQPQLTESPART